MPFNFPNTTRSWLSHTLHLEQKNRFEKSSEIKTKSQKQLNTRYNTRYCDSLLVSWAFSSRLCHCCYTLAEHRMMLWDCGSSVEKTRLKQQLLKRMTTTTIWWRNSIAKGAREREREIERKKKHQIPTTTYTKKLERKNDAWKTKRKK